MAVWRFALDGGNGYWKYTDGRKTKSTVHALRALNANEVQELTRFSGSAPFSPDYLTVYENLKGKARTVYVTGEPALQGWREYETGARRYRRGYYDVIALRALSDLLTDESFKKPNNDNQVVMMCTHAPQDNMFADKLVDTLMGWHKVDRAGHTYYYNITHVETVDEPVAGLFNYTMDGDGRPYKDIWKKQGKVLVIDIGAYTTDFQEADQHGVPLLSSHSITLGVNRSKELFKTLMRNKHRDWLVNADYVGDEQVEYAFRNRNEGKHTYESGTHSVDCSEEIDGAIAPLMVEFLSTYRNQYRNGERHATILLTGGGCGLLHLVLKDRLKHPNVVLADGVKVIQHANVWGASKLLRMMERKGLL